LPVLLVVSVVIFFIIYLTPGDPARVMLGERASQDAVEALRERMGLNDPPPLRYLRWLGGLVRGNFGTSVVNNEPVTKMILEHIEPTIYLTIYAMVVSLIIAIPLGVIAARKRGMAADKAASLFALGGISLPSFLIGLMFMMVFAVRLRLFPVSGYVSPFQAGFGPLVRSITLPAFALGFMNSAFMMRMTRSSMLEVLGSDYIKMAKAKGVKELSLVGKHALKNSLVAILAVTGQAFIATLSGAAVIEALFGIPGIGQLIVNSIGRRDYQVIQSIVLIIALANIFINLLVDIFYAVVDPRIRLE
jgi:peptide/nickel transport system permease protein